MRTQNDGEPAFPVPVGEREFWDREENGSPNGITIRDYFAAAALQGLMNQATNHRSMAIEEAEYCYSIADAMLAARKEGA
jgi:hypothetical protein